MRGRVVVVLHELILILLWVATTSALNSPIAIPGCDDTCGNISVPYPFGFGDQKCYKQGFDLTCNGTGQLFTEFAEVIDISLQGTLRVNTSVVKDCYNTSGYDFKQPYLLQYSIPYTFSNTENLFTVMGCDDVASIVIGGVHDTKIRCSMSLTDWKASDVINGSCTGICCCQTTINPEDINEFGILLSSTDYHMDVMSFNPCGYAFVVDKNWFNFSSSYLMNFTNTVPTVLNWAINWPTQNQSSCEEAMKDPTYACGNNSSCSLSKNGLGYSCSCPYGYEGNPYLEDGCQEIYNCAYHNNTCLYPLLCKNLYSMSYKCNCPSNYTGDGKKDGTGCIINELKPTEPTTKVNFTLLGIGFGFLFLFAGSLFVLWAFQKRKLSKLKERYFKENGGLLLKQQLSLYERSTESAKIFTAEELKKATNNYAESRILGQGGYGTVYKGILSNNRIVAIKKSKLVDESQIEQFINEMVILSQINHRNVVKLLGCCLETEVPLLVYEFVTNNTLFHHIHDEGCRSSISWDNRLRIATETAESLAYLHSAASPPIIHRDIKSTNILLDDNYIAKVSDFGASRLIPMDKTQLSTLVQGTLGYLDPEYFHSSQLTEKSDVYSFGVVLVELLTGKVALGFNRPENERNLAMHFVTSMNENTVWKLLENQVLQEGSKDQIQEVMELAKRCLRVKGEGRPKMKEVATVLEGLRRNEKHTWASQNPEEVEYLLRDETLIELCGPSNISDSFRGPMTI